MQVKFHLVKFGDEFVVPYYPIELRLNDFFWIFSLIMVIGFVAAFYPVRLFTKNDLVKDIRALGVKEGDLLHLKVSMKSIGDVDGGRAEHPRSVGVSQDRQRQRLDV